MTVLAVLLAGAGALRGSPAWAFSGGIRGVSGKQGVTCTVCHRGGVAPEVRFIGPTALGLGETATYRFEVESRVPTQPRAGFDIAASGGGLDILPDQGARGAANGELTHRGATPNVNMVAGWDFTWTAPDEPGTYTLFGAGNSVNFNGQASGDRSSATTIDVTVGDAATPTPTPTATPIAPTPLVTPTPVQCVGNCDASGTVTVDEIITGVNIALGNAEIDACTEIDVNVSGAAEINELIAAVDSALQGCR